MALNSFMGDGFLILAHTGDPTWKKNNNKLYVVAYPSNKQATQFLADPSTPKVLLEPGSSSIGYGIFYEPQKVSKTKFWKESNGEPTLFTVEDNRVGGVALNTRKGSQWGINGLVVRFLVDSKDDNARNVAKVSRVHEALTSVLGGYTAGAGEDWLRDALAGLMKAGLVRRFNVDEFVSVVKGAVVQTLDEDGKKEKQAGYNSVVTMDWEQHILKTEREARRERDVVR